MVNSPLTAMAWVAAAFAAALLLSALVTRIQRWIMRRRPIEDLDRVLPEAREREAFVAYFHSPQCGHCRVLTPFMAKLRDEGLPVISIDVRERPEAALALRVAGTPTLVRIRHGRVEDVLLGAQGETRIRRFVEKT
jgi:thioredoxin 1